MRGCRGAWSALRHVRPRIIGAGGLGRSGITTFVVDGVRSTDIAARLEEDGFVCAPRGGGIRISPHGYNDEAEIDALVDAVSLLARA